MKNLLIYELRKHVKTILAITMIAIFLEIFSNYYLVRSMSDYGASSLSTIKEFLAFWSFVIVRMLFFGLFVYFTNDFVKNILSDEKNFLFTLPIRSSSYFLAKILSISIFVGFVGLSLVAFNPTMREDILSYNFIRFINSALTIYSICLVALLLAYAVILISKKYLEKSRFTFLWILPFAVIFSLYLALMINTIFMTSTDIINIKSWTLVIINAVLSLSLFFLDCRLLDKRVDL